MNKTQHEDFIKALFEKNKALFGDLRMEVEDPKDPPASDPAPDPAPEGEGKEPEGVDALPDWAKKELANVRAEAANYRTKLRDAEAKLGAAKTPEEVEAAISDLREQNAKLERELLINTVATKHKLPEELAAVLKGSTPEELEQHAKVLAKFVPAENAPPPSVSGGLNPSDEDDGERDPRKLAARYRRT